MKPFGSDLGISRLRRGRPMFESMRAYSCKCMVLNKILVGVLVVVGVTVSAAEATIYAPPSGDEAEWLFDPSKVVSISLNLSQASLDALAASDLDVREYVAATFSMDAETPTGMKTFGPWEIQAKIKGMWGSFRLLPAKSAFKLKFPNGSRINGLKKLTLNNMVQDPSKVHETVSYRLFREMGVPAPRTGYAELSINGEPYGLYLNVETLDDVMLSNWYGDDNTTHLYEGSYFGWYNNELDPFDAGYEVDEGDDDNRSDLINLLELNESDSTTWFNNVKAKLDMQNVTRMWAVERYSGHWDGYSYSANNYYLHSDINGRFTMLPWGLDQTWGSWFEPSSPQGGTLFTKCMNVRPCRSRYVAALEQVRDAVLEMDLGTYARDLYASLRNYIVTDPKKEHSVEDADWWATYSADQIVSAGDRVSAWLAVEPIKPEINLSESQDTLQVTWTPLKYSSYPFEAPPDPVSKFTVFWRRVGSSIWRRRDIIDPSATTMALTAVRGGVEYEVKVAPMSGLREWSNSDVKVFTMGLPSQVLSLASSTLGSATSLRWQAPADLRGVAIGDVTYRIEMRRLSSIRWTPVFSGLIKIRSSGWYEKRVLLPRIDSAYEFRIRAEIVYGEGPWRTVHQ